MSDQNETTTRADAIKAKLKEAAAMFRMAALRCEQASQLPEMGDKLEAAISAKNEADSLINKSIFLFNRESEAKRKERNARVNPCYVCEQSAGQEYFSHPDTDVKIADELICLCEKCCETLNDLPGPEAILKAKEMRKEMGLK